MKAPAWRGQDAIDSAGRIARSGSQSGLNMGRSKHRLGKPDFPKYNIDDIPSCELFPNRAQSNFRWETPGVLLQEREKRLIVMFDV